MHTRIEQCEEEAAPPNLGYSIERLYTPPRGGAPYFTGPGIREYWSEHYWAEVRRGGHPGKAMTYGPGPHSYRLPGRAFWLPGRNGRGSQGWQI